MIKCLITLLRLGRGATIANPPPRPVIGQEYGWQAVATGPSQRYRITLSGVLPPGLIWRPGGARIVGIPTAPGSYPIELTMTGANRIPYVVRYVLTVLPLPLRLTGAFLASIVGDALAGSMRLTGGGGGYNLHAVGGTPPPGVTFVLLDDTLIAYGDCTQAGAWSWWFEVSGSDLRRVRFSASVSVGTAIEIYDFIALNGDHFTTVGAPNQFTTLPVVIDHIP